MGQGARRNDPCWCGSGKKYKTCHLGRKDETPLQPWEVDKWLRRHFEAKRCVVPPEMKASCSGDIVRAHTVPKSGSLKRIAVNGHVYAFVPGVHNIAKGDGVIAPELRSINRASTFTGFCGRHDKDLFSAVEDAPIDFTREQCFLLAYRAVARESFLKLAQMESMDLLRGADRGRSLRSQVRVQQFAADFSIGTARGVDDAERHKRFFDEVLLSRDFSGVRSHVTTFERVPPIMCSGGLFPYECFDGTFAQNFTDLGQSADVIFFTSFAAGDVGGVVFTWLPDSDAACEHFIGTLEQIPEAALSRALIRFFFEYCENTQIAPDWWDGLAESVREALVRRLSNAANARVERRPDCLLDDGLPLDDWGVIERHRVGKH